MRLFHPILFSIALLASACGTTSGGTGGGGEGGDSNPDGRAVRVDADGNPIKGDAGGDDDFSVKKVEEVKAPVYLEDISRDAQDAFREGVKAVSTARPDLKLAESKFKLAAEKAPDFLEAYFNWGQALERQGKGDEALKVYRAALERNPNNASASAYIAKVYLGRARTERFLGREKEASGWLQQAKTLLDQLVSTDPANVAVNNAMALYHLMQDDIPTAERYVKEVLYVEPTNTTGLNTRGLINLKQDKLLMAKWVFENKVLREDPSSTEAHTNLGYTYIKLDQRPLAMRHFQQALEYDQDNMEVRMNIAAMLLQHLDYAKALEHYEIVLRQQPNNVEAKTGRCDAMFGLGGSAADKPAQFRSALGCYDKLVQDRPEKAALYKRVAQTYQNRLQDLDNAVKYYELYVTQANIDAAEKDLMGKTIKTLKDIIASGGLNAMMPNPEGDPFPEETPDGGGTPDGGADAPADGSSTPE